MAGIIADTAEIGAAGAGLTEAGGTGDQFTAFTTSIASILTDTGTTIPGILGTPADTDLATDISNLTNGTTPVESNVKKINDCDITGNGNATPFDSGC